VSANDVDLIAWKWGP